MKLLKSPSAARNRQPILQVLSRFIEDSLRPNNPEKTLKVIEVASGTGEHAAFICSEIPNLVYQPTEPDVTMSESISGWTKALPSKASEILPPLSLTADQVKDTALFPPSMRGPNIIDLIICINMIHISPFSSTHQLFETAGFLLRPGGLTFLYGPYREEGQEVMCESNEAFHSSLQSRDPSWGIRDLGEVKTVAAANGLEFVEKVNMPANNLCVVFRRNDQV